MDHLFITIQIGYNNIETGMYNYNYNLIIILYHIFMNASFVSGHIIKIDIMY